MTHLLFWGQFVAFAMSFALFFANLENPRADRSLWGARLMKLGLALNLALIAYLTAVSGRCPLLNLSETFYAVSFLAVFVSAVLESRYHAKFLSLFTLPGALLVSLLGYALADPSIWSGPVKNATIIHAFLIMLGFAGLVIAASSALMYLVQSYQLKSKRIGGVFLKLPSLSTLDRIHFSMLCWGVILFSFGLVTGLFSAQSLHELKAVLKDPKVILSLAACGLYWMVLSFRLSQLRRGRKIALGTVIVFTLLFVTLLTGHYGPQGFHKGF